MAASPRLTYTIYLPGGRALHLGSRCLVMGILNITPDSFADSLRFDPASAVDAGLRMADDGADIIDVGGESTRPGAEPVSASDEAARVLPVIKALTRRLSIPVSVDTYKADVARAGVAEGATIVNDVSGLPLRPGHGDRSGRDRRGLDPDAHPGAFEGDVCRGRVSGRRRRGSGRTGRQPEAGGVGRHTDRPHHRRPGNRVC